MFMSPGRTAYDLHFSVLGIPVRVHPLFWLISFILGFGGGDPAGIVIWMGVVFVSILVHELGHALTMRHFGYQPAVVLYGGGGLAMYHGDGGSPWSSYSSYGKQRDDPVSHIIVSFAGPAAGFLLAAIVAAYMYAAGVYIDFARLFTSDPDITLVIGRGQQVTQPLLRILLFDMLFVNVLWGAVNLLPVFPLDGGQITRQLFTMYAPYDAIRQSLWLSLITAGAASLLGFMFLGLFVGAMFAMFAVMNWQMLQGMGGGGYGGGGRPW